MIVRTLDEITGTDRDVHTPTWRSRRLLLASDGQRFSLHETMLFANTETRMWYRNHVEAVLCVDGLGELENLETGEVHKLEPGTLYVLDRHERHVVRAQTDLRVICVFDPPCTGREIHDADGAYPAAAVLPHAAPGAQVLRQ